MPIKSVHNPETYQQTYQDRLWRVQTSIEKRLRYKDKHKEWKGFDASGFFNYLQLVDICAPEDKAEVESALNSLCSGVSQTVIDAAWAWYVVNMAAEHDTGCDTIILAYQCLVGETEGAKQARKRRDNTNWYTQPLVAMCKVLRKKKPHHTADEMFNDIDGLEPVEPMTKIKKGEMDNLLFEAANTHHHDKGMGRDQFGKFLTRHKDKIGCKKSSAIR